MPEQSSQETKILSSRLTKLAAGGLVSLSCFGLLHMLKIATAATTTLPVKAKLVRAIELTVDTSLDFGTLAMTIDRAGEARMDPELNRLVVDGSSSLSLAGGVPQAGRLKIKGASSPISLSIEDAAINLTNGVTAVTVDKFNFITANGGSRVTITPAVGHPSFTVAVGATLNTKPGQLTGTYVGTARIYANFQ